MNLDESLAKLSELSQRASELKEFTPEELHQLKEASLICAIAKEEKAFAPLLNLATASPAFLALPENDWEIAYLHRILGSIATEKELDAIRAASDNSQLPLSIREQLFMTITFMALEKRITSNELNSCYQQIITHAAENKYEERLAMGLIINFAVFCGSTMRKELEAFLPQAKMSGEEAASIKQAASVIAQDPAKFRSILQGQHKGLFTSYEAEAPHLDEEVVEEVGEMPRKGKPVVRTEPKIGRNDPCPCGSGKKYKKCCGKDK